MKRDSERARRALHAALSWCTHIGAAISAISFLGDPLRALDADQPSTIERDLQDDAQSVELLAMLAQSRALARGEPLTDPEVLPPFVSLKYAVEVRTSRLFGIRSAGWHTWSYVVLERPAVRRGMYRRLLLGATDHIDRDWSPFATRSSGQGWLARSDCLASSASAGAQRSFSR